MNILKYMLIIMIGVLAGCAKLDLNPLSSPSTETFFSNETEMTIAVNDLYRVDFWGNDREDFSDNFWIRSGGNALTLGTLSSDDADILTYWTACYKAISRANVVLKNLERYASNFSEDFRKSTEAQARFARGYQYSRLIAHFGDVPLLQHSVSLDSAYVYTRTGKETVLQFVFDDLDYAAANLPVSYGAAEAKRWTRGAALSIKARTALYMGKWDIARNASKAVIDLAALGTYSLHPDYRELFLSAGEASPEIILSVIQSQPEGVFNTGFLYMYPEYFLSRNSGGFSSFTPTWSLLDSYECIDGLPIDESPLYDPHDPFSHRDPRLAQTIVPHGEEWLGYTYQPHPDSLMTLNFRTNTLVRNNDTRANNVNASHTGLVWKKGIDQKWADTRIYENDLIIVRYAEALLIYAESKIELDDVDASVLNAINQVRARAYGTSVDNTTDYPAVTTTDRQRLRTLIKRERRVEFANEGLRYMDLIRWRLAETALTRPAIGFADPVNQNRSEWPFAGYPDIDENGIPDYANLFPYARVLGQRRFDKNRQYLWPIPEVEIRVNNRIEQNPNY